MKLKLIALVAFAALAGCSNPEMVDLGNDNYMIIREDYKGVFGSASSLKANVLNEASAFAASKDMVAVPVAVKEKPKSMAIADWASFEYRFKLVPKDSKEAKSSLY